MCTCMHACVSECVCACMFMCVCMHMYLCVRVCACTCVCVCMHMYCVWVSESVCACTCICVWVSENMCVYTCVRVLHHYRGLLQPYTFCNDVTLGHCSRPLCLASEWSLSVMYFKELVTTYCCSWGIRPGFHILAARLIKTPVTRGKNAKYFPINIVWDNEQTLPANWCWMYYLVTDWACHFLLNITDDFGVSFVDCLHSFIVVVLYTGAGFDRCHELCVGYWFEF